MRPWYRVRRSPKVIVPPLLCLKMRQGTVQAEMVAKAPSTVNKDWLVDVIDGSRLPRDTPELTPESKDPVGGGAAGAAALADFPPVSEALEDGT